MSRRRVILLVLLMLALGVATFGHPWRWTEAALLMADIAAAGRDSPWKWVTDAPQRLPIAWKRNDIVRAGDLYRPQGQSRGAMVLSPGAAPRGRDDPRLIAFAETLTRAGFIVLVPDIADLRNLQPSVNDIATIADAIDELVAHAPSHKPGILAISYALGPALIAAVERDNCNGMGFIVGVGGFHDSREVVRYFTTGNYRPPDETTWRETQPNEFGKWLFVLANARRLENDKDRRLLMLIANARLRQPDAEIGDWFGQLGTEGRRVFDLIANTDPRQVDRLIAALPRNLQVEMERLNPARFALQDLRCRIILVHGQDDRIIPFSQSVALQRAIGGSNIELHLPNAIGHVEVDALAWSNVAPLWRAIDSLLTLRD